MRGDSPPGAYRLLMPSAHEEAQGERVKDSQVRRVQLLHHRAGAFPEASPVAQDGRLVAPVLRVRSVLHVSPLARATPLHRAQDEGASERRAAGERSERAGHTVQGVRQDVRRRAGFKHAHAHARHGLHQIQETERS